MPVVFGQENAAGEEGRSNNRILRRWNGVGVTRKLPEGVAKEWSTELRLDPCRNGTVQQDQAACFLLLRLACSFSKATTSSGLAQPIDMN